MSRQFRVGQKVRCIDAEGTTGGLVQGEVYVVSETHTTLRRPSISLEGRSTNQQWYEERFSLVEEFPAPTLRLTLSEHVTCVFDVSNPESRKFVDAFIDAVYKSLEAA